MILVVILLPMATASAQEGDSQETMEWVKVTATILEERLTNAINVTDEANLLVKLMESSNDFEAVALLGLYCHEARTAAESGRNYCNWLKSFSRDKDLNSLIIRAQEARRQATRMRDAATVCQQKAMLNPPEVTFTLSDIIRSNAETIEHDITDGLASQNFHILSQKIEHALRGFQDTDLLTARLSNCEAVQKAAQEGSQACISALAAPNWTMVTTYLQQASNWAGVILAKAGDCR
jgi:hypothetical protein